MEQTGFGEKTELLSYLHDNFPLIANHGGH